ncbi:class I SAM-dependent methyltransferase [Halobacteria archaeon AArc-curdl1]|uniref:Class I SAM-dependent methyltransferase n=1 Tax=Natronosalvus hydrolyticus TaxID=2979988 RepID=A0AAP2Z901_9EURY|nr:class I SAM-dependent methyltransferase [Halobacteria archaeon AArc-curdl1]
MPEPESNMSTSQPTNEPNDSDALERSERESEGASDRWRKRVWSAGSYATIAPKYLPMGGRLVARTGVAPGDDVLDIGCGTGTVAITAARRDGNVTGVDITPELIERARESADRAGVGGISWQTGDATDLPFAANTFDVTLSNLGHMYGDPPDTATAELLRVTRPGGRIGFTSWTPTSLYPSMAGEIVVVIPPDNHPDFSEPPFLWGDSGIVRARLGDAVETLEFETDTVRYPALSPAHFLEQMTQHSGMFIEALEAVDDGDRPALRDRLIDTIESSFDGRENAVELEYLCTTATVSHTE